MQLSKLWSNYCIRKHYVILLKIAVNPCMPCSPAVASQAIANPKMWSYCTVRQSGSQVTPGMITHNFRDYILQHLHLYHEKVGWPSGLRRAIKDYSCNTRIFTGESSNLSPIIAFINLIRAYHRDSINHTPYQIHTGINQCSFGWKALSEIWISLLHSPLELDHGAFRCEHGTKSMSVGIDLTEWEYISNTTTERVRGFGTLQLQCKPANCTRPLMIDDDGCT